MYGQPPAPQQNPMELLKLQAQLFQKIGNVVANVKAIEQSGFNKHQNYAYSTEKDLVGAIRDLLTENKLLVLTDSENKETIRIPKTNKDGTSTETIISIVNTRHTFCDTETGYTFTVQSTGSGADVAGDKFIFKSITGAMKYFISKNFLVATEDDPEEDGMTKNVTNAQTPSKLGFNRTKVDTTPSTANTKNDMNITITNHTDNGNGATTGTIVVNTPIQVSGTKTTIVEPTTKVNAFVGTVTDKVTTAKAIGNDTSQVTTKFSTPSQSGTISQSNESSNLVTKPTVSARPGFSRRATTVTKGEPNFP